MKATDASVAVIKAVGVVLELTGTDLSPAALGAVCADLATYPEHQVLAALNRCRRELKPRQFSLAAVIERIDDGRPTPEIAWAMVPKDERSSVCWTTEMREAFRAAYPLIKEGESVQARMAFLEAYRSQVQLARDARLPVEWELSLGYDKDGRELVVLDAAEKGRITVAAACAALPYHRQEEGLSARLLAIGARPLKALSAPGKKAAA
jgi:hypothetical protein